MYKGKYGAVIGHKKPSNLKTQTAHIQKRELSSQSQRRVSACIM